MRPLLLALSLLLPLPLFAADPPVATILGYHEVDRADALQARRPRLSAAGDAQAEGIRYAATVESFVAQMDYLRNNGYHVIPLAELVAYLRGEVAELPPRAVVITFDDGWACTYHEVLPRLKQYGMPFTAFIYPDSIGKGSHLMTWSDVEGAVREGVNVESHTYTHPFLTLKMNHKVAAEAYDGFLRRELLDSKTEIEKRTGTPVRYLCYPFGDYDETVAAAAKEYGYEAALTTQRGPITRSTPLFELRRYLIHNDTTLDEFKTFLLP